MTVKKKMFLFIYMKIISFLVKNEQVQLIFQYIIIFSKCFTYYLNITRSVYGEKKSSLKKTNIQIIFVFKILHCLKYFGKFQNMIFNVF